MKVDMLKYNTDYNVTNNKGDDFMCKELGYNRDEFSIGIAINAFSAAASDRGYPGGLFTLRVSKHF